ncbi:MAG: D-glycero-beta-D-manno-heptose-7-phosphate kinase [Candidatus Eremiobacteraeota bacterium]|nr:D-glycero-beta-D-manno-heptose-7-phosphate kinase [Candidatus Eremiobacteraeota bacterium]
MKATERDRRWMAELLGAMRGKRIGVVGDIMLDEWYWGTVRRISPEAPVPVVEVQDHTYTLGGAGNVANNLAALGARVWAFGVIGDDDAGSRVLQLFRALSVNAEGVVRIGSRPTTQKMRIVAHNQQVVRADSEATHALEGRVEQSLRHNLSRMDGSLDAVVISDYGKGLVTPPLVKTVRGYKQRAIITADPKPQNLDAFKDVDCIAPNAAEAESASGVRGHSEAELSRAAAVLMERTRARYVLITRGEQGMTLFARGKKPFTVPAVARQIYDVSGAGDTVMSTLTLALAVGAPVERAVTLANMAAGVVVEKLGTATATPEEILKFALTEDPPARAGAARKAAHGRGR